MIRLFLSVVVLITWTSIEIFGTEQLTQTDSGSQLAISKRSLLTNGVIRRTVVRVLDFEDRIVRDAVVWEGTKVTITCKMHGFPKGTRLSWIEPSGATTFPTQYGLKVQKVFSRVTQSNSGRYICNADDPERGRYISSSVLLNVEATPTIHTNNVTAVEGKHAVLRCTGTDHTKSYSILWLYEGNGLHSDANIQIAEHTTRKQTRLTIHRVSRHHSGTYECRVTIGGVKISAYSHLTVLYPPDILEGPSNVTAAVGATVTFRCNVTGFPEPVVTWELNGMPINTSKEATAQGKINQSSEKDSHVLTVTDVQQGADSGLYICRIHNNHGVPLFESAYLEIQGLPSPTRIEVEAIYGNGTTLLAAINWTKPTYDGNSPITAYQLECKIKNHDKFYTKQVDSDIFFGEIPCGFIHQLNHSLPFLLDLVTRVLTYNTIGSTSSNLLNLTVEIVASQNNQSSFEVLRRTPSAVPTLPAITSTIQPYSHADYANSSKEPQGHTSNSSVPTSSTKTLQHTLSENSTFGPSSSLSGDSDAITTGTWYMFPETEPITTNKESGTTSQPPVQFLTEAATNRTDLAETNASSEGKGVYIGVSVTMVLVALLIVSLVIAGVRHHRRKHPSIEKSRVDQAVKPQPRQHVESPTIEDYASVQVDDELSETPTGSVSSDAEVYFGILDETDIYSFRGSTLDEKVGPEGQDFQSGNLFVSVPSGAVSCEERIRAHFVFDMEPMPIPENWSVFSPILALQPHGLSFDHEKLVSIRFPFTATLEGWILELMRERDTGLGWKSVLTIDTDTQRVTSRDSHCNYDVNTSFLQLSHFCKYRWCGYIKENSSGSKKTIVCSLFARMDSSRTACNFFLYLGDNCQDIIEAIQDKENSKCKEAFEFKDSENIVITKVGFLKIQCNANGFDLKVRKEMTVDLRDLWPKSCGILKRLHVPAKRTGRTDGANDLELCVSLSTSARPHDPIHVLAVFDESGRRGQKLHTTSSQPSLDSGVSETQKSANGRPSVSSPGPSSDDPATYEVIQRASLIACEGLEWVAFGKELLHYSHSEVRNLFPGPIEGLKNSEKVEMIINKWKETNKLTATVGNLRAAFCHLKKEGSFDRDIRKDLEERVSDEEIQAACTLACNGQDWVKLGKVLLVKRTDAEIRDLFPDSREGQIKNSDRVSEIIDKFREKHGEVTIGQLRAAFSRIGKCGQFDEIVAETLPSH